MIEKYELSVLLEKYGINPKKIIDKNENILTYGEYIDINNTLDYLVNELNINIIYIEKCPSIMYLNVSSIKSNVKFLKKNKIRFSSVENCLHVLSTTPEQLEETYEYVERKYGVKWWRPWNIGDGTIGMRYGDTLKRHNIVNNLIVGLKKDPMSRRHVCTMWQ